MKIIKRGEVPGNEVYRLDCNHCHTEFEIKASEAKYNHEHLADAEELLDATEPKL